MSILNYGLVKHETSSVKDSTDSALVCFCDGSCTQNGKRSARASFATVWPNFPHMNEAHILDNGKSTNNRAEFSGALHAINQSDIIDPSKKRTLIIYTESMLLINSVTKWMYSWKKNNWRNWKNQDVKNVDLLKELDDCLKKRCCVFRFVRAHTGGSSFESINNDLADKLATDINKT